MVSRRNKSERRTQVGSPVSSRNAEMQAEVRNMFKILQLFKRWKEVSGKISSLMEKSQTLSIVAKSLPGIAKS